MGRLTFTRVVTGRIADGVPPNPRPRQRTIRPKPMTKVLLQTRTTVSCLGGVKENLLTGALITGPVVLRGIVGAGYIIVEAMLILLTPSSKLSMPKEGLVQPR